MRIIPYTHPIQKDFLTTRFKTESETEILKLQKILFGNPSFRKGLQDVWVSYSPKKIRVCKTNWIPKLYVCVSAQDYWKCVHRFVKNFGSESFSWKFYMAPNGYERPDKIVFYASSKKQLLFIIKKIRKIIKSFKKFHSLHHTASTHELGLESGSRAQGIYIGIDPPFNESWRMYRSICVVWADLNRDYLANKKGGIHKWFEEMNLSYIHQGPYSLNPPIRLNRLVYKRWKQMK